MGNVDRKRSEVWSQNSEVEFFVFKFNHPAHAKRHGQGTRLASIFYIARCAGSKKFCAILYPGLTPRGFNMSPLRA